MTTTGHDPLKPDTALLLPVSIARWLLVILLAVSVYFFHGFIVPVFAAMVIAFASWPLYQRILDALNGNRTLAASVALIISVIFLVIPLTILGAYAIKEVTIWLAWAVEANANGAAAPRWLDSLPLVGEWLTEQWDDYIGHPGMIGEHIQFISGAQVATIYRSVLAASGSLINLALTGLFMLIALFFIFRDGTSFAAQLDRIGDYILPRRWRTVSRIVPAAVRSTVVGMGLIAIGEGIVLGVAYWVAGVPSPVMLGVLTGIMAMIPGGAPLSFTLVSIYLIASGSPLAGVLLFVWGSVELFIVDKMLRPRLVGGPIQLPFLPTFFGLVGGVKTMGFIGLFIGPVLMALIVSIWREALRELDIATGNAPEQG